MNNSYFRLLVGLLFVILNLSCSSKKETSKTGQLDLTGTWQMISNTITKNDSTHIIPLEGNRMIKVFNETHFSFFNHNIQSASDSTSQAEEMFAAGAGTYQLQGNEYTEYLEYCTYRPIEGQEFHFTMELKGDTLIQSGKEEILDVGMNQIIEERYVRTIK